MYQQEIDYFFPLTEQIPLELDYSGCSKFSPYVTTGTITPSNISFITPGGVTWTTTIRADGIETNGLTFALDKQPNFVVRWLYKLLNIKWTAK